MDIAPQELMAVLRQYNPWWNGQRVATLPAMKRAAYRELVLWLRTPPAPRAVLLSGARQVGKTTLLLQAAEALILDGAPSQNVLYVTLDHPLLRSAGLDGLLKIWREYEPSAEDPEYLFVDEIQFAPDWQSWLKLQVDFFRNRRIAVTDSSTPLTSEGQESGVGRWHTLRLATFSFYEYLLLRGIETPALPEIASFAQLFHWTERDFARAGELAQPLTAHFHEYLLRGGFPQCAQVADIETAQKLLREDIVDKILRRDMTAFFGVRRVLELEQTFLYLCLHDGCQIDVPELCKNLEVKKPTALNFLALLEAAHLIYRLPPFGYGKEVLRGRHKVYLADASIAPSVMLKGRAMLDDPAATGQAVEGAFFKHIFTRYYHSGVSFSYWRGHKDEEVDIIADTGQERLPFEVKYRLQHTRPGDLKGLIHFCREKNIDKGYVITRETTDFGVLDAGENDRATLLKIPAPLACYWLSRSELESSSISSP